MTTIADCSYLLFVYPFVFNDDEFELRCRALETARWPLSREESINDNSSGLVWEAARFPGADMLAYVANYLNPPEGAHATARLWKLNDELQNVYGLAGRADWRLIIPRRDNPEIPFRFGEVGKTKADFAVQLALFRVGVGFITVRIQPQTDDLNSWLDFVHFFRFVKGQRGVTVRAMKQTGFDKQTGKATTTSFFPEPAGGPSAQAGDKHLFSDVLHAFLGTAADGSNQSLWWQEVFIPEQMIPFAVIFADGIPAEDDLKLAFKLRNWFHSRQGENPSRLDLAPDHPNLMPYAERQWMTFSLDGGAFLACDAPQTQFFRTDLPAHFRDHYFILFLLCLHQRFLLMSLSKQVSDNWLRADEAQRVEAFERIRGTLLEFMARGLFTQIMQREHHHRSYVQWQKTFQISDLFREALEEVREMHSYLQARRAEQIRQLAEARQQQIEKQTRIEASRERAAQERARHLEERISLLTVCIGLPALIMAFLGINLIGFTSDQGLKTWVALAIVLATTVLLVTPVLILLMRNKRKANEVERDREL